MQLKLVNVSHTLKLHIVTKISMEFYYQHYKFKNGKSTNLFLEDFIYQLSSMYVMDRSLELSSLLCKEEHIL
jgi:hypothetical protein